MYSEYTPTVLFICRDNAVCSQLAAAWLYRLSSGKIQAQTAGIEPCPIPSCIQQRVSQLKRRPVSLKPVALKRVSGKTYDHIITLTDKREAPLPLHPYDEEGVVWDFAMPASAEALRQLEFELMDRLLLWLEVVRVRAA